MCKPIVQGVSVLGVLLGCRARKAGGISGARSLDADADAGSPRSNDGADVA
jgi:hypothetical protein